MEKFSAEPTKDFFITMLTRDIPLERAIVDLIDNSIDGAKSQILKAGKSIFGKNAYKGYAIDITFNKDQFIIVDNCGGFTKKDGDSHAFRFGRPLEAGKLGAGSVGRFGVGMKRALFKMGGKFIVETKSSRDHFQLDIDVDEWSKNGDWEFPYLDTSDFKKGKKAFLRDRGTYIEVSDLHDSVKLDFGQALFQTVMINAIQQTLNYNILRGLYITVNGIALKSDPIKLLIGDKLKPAMIEEKLDGVEVKIFAGLGEPNPDQAGWYIYCNDRMMVGADKTNITGWEGTKYGVDEAGVQKYHNKVAMFRGLVFFSSDSPELLPMTTTKWGIDENSAVYKSVRVKMIATMRKVLAEINSIQSAEERVNIVKKAEAIDIVSYNGKDLTEAFVFPKIIRRKTTDSNLQGVKYWVDKDLLGIVKKHTKSSTAEDAGLKTFNFYVKINELQ